MLPCHSERLGPSENIGNYKDVIFLNQMGIYNKGDRGAVTINDHNDVPLLAWSDD